MTSGGFPMLSFFNFSLCSKIVYASLYRKNLARLEDRKFLLFLHIRDLDKVL
jgi:hypothetical protein